MRISDWSTDVCSSDLILEDHGGGMKDGYQLKCWLPGGASTDFLMPEHLDLAMDFDTIAKAGSRMGTGLLTVVDHKQNMISVVRNLEEFFSRESCGWCTPCRDGRSEEHTSELQSLMRISYAVFCLKKKTRT